MSCITYLNCIAENFYAAERFYLHRLHLLAFCNYLQNKYKTGERRVEHCINCFESYVSNCLSNIYAIAMHAFRFFPVVTSYMQTILTPCADLCLNESIWLQLPTVFLTDFMILSYYKKRQ